MSSERAAGLALRVNEAASRFIEAIASVHEEPWRRLPEPGVWSIGKEAKHVAEAGGYHQWIVRLTIGEKVSSLRPALDRREMTSRYSAAEVVDIIRERTDEGAMREGRWPTARLP